MDSLGEPPQDTLPFIPTTPPQGNVVAETHNPLITLVSHASLPTLAVMADSLTVPPEVSLQLDQAAVNEPSLSFVPATSLPSASAIVRSSVLTLDALPHTAAGSDAQVSPDQNPLLTVLEITSSVPALPNLVSHTDNVEDARINLDKPVVSTIGTRVSLLADAGTSTGYVQPNQHQGDRPPASANRWPLLDRTGLLQNRLPLDPPIDSPIDGAIARVSSSNPDSSTASDLVFTVTQPGALGDSETSRANPPPAIEPLLPQAANLSSQPPNPAVIQRFVAPGENLDGIGPALSQPSPRTVPADPASQVRFRGLVPQVNVPDQRLELATEWQTGDRPLIPEELPALNISRPSVQDKNPVTQVLRYAKPELQGFCPVPSSRSGMPSVKAPLAFSSRLMGQERMAHATIQRLQSAEPSVQASPAVLPLQPLPFRLNEVSADSALNAQVALGHSSLQSLIHLSAPPLAVSEVDAPNLLSDRRDERSAASTVLFKLIQYRNGKYIAPPIPVLNQLEQGSNVQPPLENPNALETLQLNAIPAAISLASKIPMTSVDWERVPDQPTDPSGQFVIRDRPLTLGDTASFRTTAPPSPTIKATSSSTERVLPLLQPDVAASAQALDEFAIPPTVQPLGNTMRWAMRPWMADPKQPLTLTPKFRSQPPVGQPSDRPTQLRLQQLFQSPLNRSEVTSRINQRLSHPAIPLSDPERIQMATNQPLVPERLRADQIPQHSPLDLEDGSLASSADLTNAQPGMSFLGLSPGVPPSDSTSSISTPAASKPAPPPPAQPERSPQSTRQPPPLPDPVLVMMPPRPSLSLDSYLNRRKRGNP